MKLIDYLGEKYANRSDKGNMYGIGISDREFVQFAIQYLLGDDWIVSDPIGHTQINEITLCEILEKHSKKYRKEQKQHQKEHKQ